MAEGMIDEHSTFAALAFRLQGMVQGCGVRPAIARLAQQLALSGWVENAGDHVQVHAQGHATQVKHFADTLPMALPKEARLDSCQVGIAVVDPTLDAFSIRVCEEAATSPSLPDLPADRAICPQCLAELRDPQSRRYGWPFIACAACGPRYSWLKALPFARGNTTFSDFSPCTICSREHADVDDKRFGMELIACPACGPALHYMDRHRNVSGHESIRVMAECIVSGGVVALQGFSGFQLLGLASRADAVAKIRQFKARCDKPLALLARSVDDVARVAIVGESEREWLAGPHRPIVLLRRHDRTLWPWVAQDNPRWGVMLPSHGMHALLMDALAETLSDEKGLPQLLVATSANLRGDPVAGNVEEVLPWLGKGIDAICHHTVPVWQVQDDSVLAVLEDGPLFLRRARGFAHEILTLTSDRRDGFSQRNVLGVGAFLKTTVCLRANDRLLLSQYVGDKESIRVQERMRVITQRLAALCGFQPQLHIVDAHPDMPVDDVFEKNVQVPATTTTVFHHRSHVAALVAEHGLVPPALVAAWDGIGYGEDGQWWGSEVFSLTGSSMRPLFGLQPFALPGGDRCAREPWRVMVALLLDSGVEADDILSFLSGTHRSQALRSKGTPTETVQRLVIDSLQQAQAFPHCTSMGRFVEGIAALLLRFFENEYEAQAASALEFAALSVDNVETHEFTLSASLDVHGIQRWDWRPMVAKLWARLQAGENPALLARSVLNTLAECLLVICRESGFPTLGISGGCFQNLYWVNYLRQQCEQAGIRLIRPMRFPPNDGAIALGQVLSLAATPT